jgi:Protein of unknown function (DUF3606)
MPDDKTKVGQPDRNRLSADQNYEVQQFADKHGITGQQVKDLIARHGDNRQKLEQEAIKLSRSGT